jgi:hypothetical protein
MGPLPCVVILVMPCGVCTIVCIVVPATAPGMLTAIWSQS